MMRGGVALTSEVLNESAKRADKDNCENEHADPDVDIDETDHDHIDVEDDDAGDVEVDGEDTHYL